MGTRRRQFGQFALDAFDLIERGVSVRIIAAPEDRPGVRETALQHGASVRGQRACIGL
jgi:hypothetical protein